MPERNIWIPNEHDALEALSKMSKSTPVIKDPRGGRWFFTWTGDLSWSAGVQQSFPQHKYHDLPKRNKAAP